MKKISTPHANILAYCRKSLIYMVGAFLLLPVFTYASTAWNGGSNDFTDGNNWSLGVPDSETAAVFDGSATTTDGITVGASGVGHVLSFSFSGNKDYRFTSAGEYRIQSSGFSHSGSGIIDFEGLVKLTANPTVFDITGGGRVRFAQLQGWNVGFTGGQNKALTINGGGTLELYGAANNANITNLNVNLGTVELNKTPGTTSFAGPITFGNNNGTGAAGSAVVRAVQNNQLGGASNILLNNAGQLDIGATTQTYSGASFGARGGDLVMATGGNLILTNNDLIIQNNSTASTGMSTLGAGGAGTVTLNGTQSRLTVVDRGNPVDMRIDAVVAGSNELRRSGSGTLLFGGSQDNTHSGLFRIEEGRTILARDGISIAGDIRLLNGTLEFQDFGNQIASTSSLEMNAGSLLLNGFSNELSGLVVDGNSVIDFGSGTAELTFLDSATFSSGSLTLLNWEGTVTGTAGDRLLFGFDPTGFISDLGANLIFDGFGEGANVVDLGGGVWAVTAIPEPNVYGVFLGLGVLLLSIARRRRP